jgi:glucose/mannose-6-phosphate isomerase
MAGKERFLSVINAFPRQVEEAARLGKDVKVLGEVDRVVVTGIGGSDLPGELLKAYLNIKVPIFVNHDYDLPEFVNSKTLVFVVSYSGNTEESLAAFKVAFRKNCRIVGMSSGGKLRDFCLKNSLPHILVPGGLQPRMALGYLFFPLLNTLYSSHLIPNPENDVNAVVAALRKADIEEKAKELAEKLAGKIPIIYSSNKLAAVAYKWKINFNENSKTHAFCNTFPELNHNEITGYTKLNAYYYVIMLQDEDDYRRIKERMSLTKDLITNKGVEVTQIALTGECLLSRMFSAIHLGDLTSYYLALLNKVDPEPVEMQENLKKKLAEKKF